MIQSMTGFGRAEKESQKLKVSLQIRSLNSKHMDLNLRLPSALKEIEGELRKLVSEKLKRGKIEIQINASFTEEQGLPSINKTAFKKYYNELDNLAYELDAKSDDFFPIISRFPEILSNEDEIVSEESKQLILSTAEEAIENLIRFRLDEGQKLQLDIKEQIEEIETQLQKALSFEDERIENVRSRINQKLNEYIDTEKIDQDRFEQEMIYYLEKFDVSEEKVRLRTHCNYFKEVMEQEDAQGKKLNFISQEIGREINTLGSKANHAEMQKAVVLMKDALEKIKEQVLNVL